jgi:coenzyme F420-dependent glucose-6-phosphate dehydrogenase
MTMRFGYHLSAEEHAAPRLVDLAVRAEQRGFAFATISDHFHPWLDTQGESPFVWSVLGAIAHATERLEAVTAVTCPTIRIHPATVAQAAATTSTLMPGRFALGVGSGENLNEHVVGARWPAPRDRLALLEEAIDVIRQLFTGELVAHRGRAFEVEDARLYSLPEEPPPIHLAASGPVAASLAGRCADGLILDGPNRELAERFHDEGDGRDRPVYGKLMVCWGEDREAARRTALEWWPVGGVGTAGADLRLPSDFAAVAENLDDDAALSGMVVTDDLAEIEEAARAFEDAGVTHLSLHQVGPDQETFLDAAADVFLGRS